MKDFGKTTYLSRKNEESVTKHSKTQRRKDDAGMRRPKEAESVQPLPKMRPALTPEAREGQLIALATDLVEQRLRDGTATSQEVVHFLRLGSMRERLERERLENENILLRAKTEALESQARIEELYADAIRAMQRYSGAGSASEIDDEDE